MRDLLPARKPGRDNHIVGTRRPNRGKQPLLANLPRNLVMLLLVTKRAGHAATASVQVYDFSARNAPHQTHQRLDADECALMTMRMNKYAASRERK